ncbi:MAG: hypothetical protein WC651_02925 [Candidatus Gracilibacteria bacterium]|jgi:hypothetical protein
MKKSLVILISAVFLLSGCALTNFFKSEKDRFIGATSEALCLIFTSENPVAPSEETSDKVMDIYSNYGFNSDDQAGMEAITRKYEEDNDVKVATAEALKKCSGIDITAPAPEDAATTETPDAEAVPATTEQPVK